MKYEEENEKKEHATHKEMATYEGGEMRQRACNEKTAICEKDIKQF